MDKLILVYYVNVGNLDKSEVPEFMGKFIKYVKDDNIIQYHIPVRGEKSRIECINPKLINKDEFKKVQEILDSCKLKVENFLK